MDFKKHGALLFKKAKKKRPGCTANVYRDLQGLYREIRVRGFQIYGDCMLLAIPVILKSPHSDSIVIFEGN